MGGEGLMAKSLTGQPVVTVRIEPNAMGSRLLWTSQSSDGTSCSGFAASYGDAMRDAAAFVEAMAQPRVGGLFKKPALHVIEGGEKV
jgi:hypothetical protein